MKTIRKVLVLLIPILVVCLLTGCGASVSTQMTIDDKFAGTRKITLEISNDDLDYVTGGIDGLENVIKTEIPDVMSYEISDYSDGKSIVFTIEYTSLSDYRTKVNTIISAGITEEEKANDDILVPNVVYERNDSYFKKGIKFDENFTSVDLLDWFREGLRTAAIISESESNWYENGDHVVTIEDTAYSSYNYFSVENQENTCLSSCDVSTVVFLDNTFERTILFTAYSDTITTLSENGCNLEEYFKGLAPEGCEFVVDEEEYQTTYRFVFSAANTEELIAKTNTILQTTTNTFSLETTLDEDRLGVAEIAVSELLDGSFYLDYDGYYHPLTSSIYVYNNSSVTSSFVGDSSVRYQTVDGGFTYSPSSSLEYRFNLDWQIEFKDIDFDISSAGKDKVSVTLDCRLADVLSDEMKKSAIDRMKSFFQTDDAYEADDDSIVITFSGEIWEVQNEINLLIATADGSTAEPDDDYFSIKKYGFDTPSLFTNGASYSVWYDFTPLLGATDLKVKEQDNLFGSKYYEGNTSTNADGETCLPSSGTVSVYEINLSIIVIVIAVLCFALIVVGILLLLRSLKPFKAYLAYKKQNKPQVSARAQQPAAQPLEQPVAQGASLPQEEDTKQPAVVGTNTNDEEDIL